jgi:hypothetical protein
MTTGKLSPPLLAILLAASACPSAAAYAPTTAIADPVQSALESVADVDPQRLLADREYARSVLRQIQVLRASQLYEGELKPGLDMLEATALVGAGEEVKALDALLPLIRQQPQEASLHTLAFILSAWHRPAIAPEVATVADRSLREQTARAKFREGLEIDAVARAWRDLAETPASKARLAEALLNFGWPTDAEIEFRDRLRLEVVKDRLGRGDVTGAATMADRITAPTLLLKLVTEARYTSLPSYQAPRQRVERGLAEHDRLTAAALAADPNDPSRLLQRAQYLRGADREAEVVALLQPHVSDIKAVAAKGERSFWLVNEAAYALLAQDRPKQAGKLMQDLLAVGYDGHPYLINMAINLGNMMVAGGRHREGADYSVRLFANRSKLASEYGHMWMWSAAACGYALAGDGKAAGEWLSRLRAKASVNRSAFRRALLCADDLSGAAAVTVEGLADAESDFLVDAQDFRLGSYRSATRRLLEQRYRAMLQRPEVKAELAKNGRVLEVPLSRVAFGPF